MTSPETLDFIQQHKDDNLAVLLLQKNKYPHIDWEWAIQQIEGPSLAQQKIPSLAAQKEFIFPQKISLEQASSETTARYKCRFSNQKNVFDGTGGLGIDSLFFAQNARKVLYMDQQEQLVEIAKHHFKLFQAKHAQALQGNSIEYLQHCPDNFDLLYFDPARRGKNNQKLFTLSDTEPNLIPHLDLLFQKAPLLLIKASPMLDISLALKQLACVSEVHVLAIKNECKELLFLCDPTTKTPDNPQIFATHFSPDRVYTFRWKEEAEAQTLYAPKTKTYIYDPWSCVLKAGAFKILTTDFSLEKLHPHAHLYTSDLLIDNFPGRCFRVEHEFAPKKELLKKWLPLAQAHIACRNYPIPSPQLRKNLHIKDGGDQYLFFTTNIHNEKIVLLTRKIE